MNCPFKLKLAVVRVLVARDFCLEINNPFKLVSKFQSMLECPFGELTHNMGVQALERRVV